MLTNLISYWQLDESSGNAVDIHGTNTLTANVNPGTAAGKIGTARTFNGSNQFFSIASNASLQTGDIDFTVQAWVYLQTKAANRQVLGKWRALDNNRESRIVYASGVDRFLFQVSSNGSTATSAQDAVFGSPTINEWIHVLAWHDSASNQIAISINNGTPTTTSTTAGVFSSAAMFTLGSTSDAAGGDFWSGRIDEVGFWKRVLTPTERSLLYNNGNGLAYPFRTNSTFLMGIPI